MPTVDDHKELALATLRRFVQPDTEPKLDDTELNAILDSVQRASFWEASKAFVFGAVVMPITRNGHRFVCTQGGQTTTTEPEWPARNGAAVTDGDVQWREAGAAYENVFDVQAAIQQSWLVKAAKASVLFDRDRQFYSQIHEHCKTMADSFEPIKFA